MFLGSYRHQVDVKGRVAVPAQFRRGLPEGSVISIGPEGRLVMRPPQEWEALQRAHSAGVDTPQDERRFLRSLYASARGVELDGQGRLLLDADHKGYARIGGTAVFVGLGTVVEVVGADVWDAEQAAMDADSFTALNDRVLARGTVDRA